MTSPITETRPDTPLPPSHPGCRWRALLGRPSIKVALVSLYVIENTGARLLAAVLRNAGVQVHEFYFKDWITNRISPPEDSEVELLLNELVAVQPDIVGLSVRASAFHEIATSLTVRIRERLGVPVLWGGMHASSCPEDAARIADLVCVGEAEETLKTLIEKLGEGEDVSGIDGLWVHTPDGLKRNGAARLVADLDALPFPDYHSLDKVFVDRGRVIRNSDPCTGEPIYMVMGSRGCPFPSCTFCSNSIVDEMYPGQKYHRVRSVGHVLGEIRYAREHFTRLKRVRFDDEEFPVSSDWLDEFCRRWPQEIGLPFEIHMDPRVVTAERLAKLKAVGLDMVFMGIQHTEKINRDLYRRNVSDQQVLDAAQAIHASGVRAGYQVILDDPVSTSDDKRALFDLILQLPRPYEMVLFSLTVYPGSALERELRKRGLIGDGDVEGKQKKVFRQFRVDLSYPRATEDRFWTALNVLVSKSFVPKSLLRQIAGSRQLRLHPGPVTVLAYIANMAKLGWMGLGLLFRGEMSVAVVRRWLSFKSAVTY